MQDTAAISKLNITKDQTGRCGLYWDVSHLNRVELLVKTRARTGPGHLHLTWRHHHSPPLTLTLTLRLYFSDLTDVVYCILFFYIF